MCEIEHKPEVVVLSGLENYPLGSNNEVTRLMALFSWSERFLRWGRNRFLSVSFKDPGSPGLGSVATLNTLKLTESTQKEPSDSGQVIVPMATRHPTLPPPPQQAGIPGGSI